MEPQSNDSPPPVRPIDTSKQLPRKPNSSQDENPMDIDAEPSSTGILEM